MAIRTYTFNDVSSLVHHLEHGGEAHFYRGQAQDWPLVASIGRVGRGGFEELKDFEEQILHEFRRLASPYYANPPASMAEWLLHAQHHGLPTRLLDWTTNPLKALFFAVQDDRNKADGVVWSLDPLNVEWNDPLPDLTAELHYFHRPAHLNTRIVAQESAFLVFPLLEGQVDMQPPNLEDGAIYGSVDRVIIPGASKTKIKRFLAPLGIHALSIYPSVEAVAASIREQFYMDDK
jgi:hypothetical protein